MAGQLISSLGLVLDIAGALLVWKFGIPEQISRDGSQSLVLLQKDEGNIAKAKRYDKRSRRGMGLLALGFLLQLVGLWLPNLARLWNP